MTPASVPIHNEFASTEPIHVGAVVWPDSSNLTVIVKLTVSVDASGATHVLSPGRPLWCDERASQGEPEHSSDFAPYKPRCDIVIIERDVFATSGPAVFSCGSMSKSAADGESLGARPSSVPPFDPEDENGKRVWASGQLDYSKFQAAPIDQRVDGVGLPLRLDYRRNNVEMSAVFSGPTPEAALLDRTGWSAIQPIALGLDTIGVAPSLRLLTLVWRGVAALPRQSAEPPLIVVGLGPLRAHSARAMAAWPLRPLVFPRRASNRPTSMAPSSSPAHHPSSPAFAAAATVVPETLPSSLGQQSSVGRRDMFDDRTALGVTPRQAAVLPFKPQAAPVPLVSSYNASLARDATSLSNAERPMRSTDAVPIVPDSRGAPALPFRAPSAVRTKALSRSQLPDSASTIPHAASSGRGDWDEPGGTRLVLSASFALAPATPFEASPDRASLRSLSSLERDSEPPRNEVRDPRALVADVMPASPWQAETSIGFLIPRSHDLVREPARVDLAVEPAEIKSSWGVPTFMAQGSELAPELGRARLEDAALPMNDKIKAVQEAVLEAPEVRSAAEPAKPEGASDTLPDESSIDEGPLPIEEFPLQRCARIAASMAMRPSDCESILSESHISLRRFGEIEQHWNAAILADAARAEVDLMQGYDNAYVGQIEAERGPVEIDEYARMVVAREKGTLSDAMSDLDIPRAAWVRLQRVWLKKITGDMAFGKSVNRAIKLMRG